MPWLWPMGQTIWNSRNSSLSQIDFQHPSQAEASGLNIMLVEDNPVNQELATRLLERQSHRVTLANNGAEAIELFDSGHFDVILMDMQMPVMGGVEATKPFARVKCGEAGWCPMSFARSISLR
jgi:PleD family two-component response regulator